MNTVAPTAPKQFPVVFLSPVVVPLLTSALAWALLFASVPPARQNFALNDDWAFGAGAIQFAQGDGIHYENWASMPQLGQWLWACPFIWAFGKSFVSLRLATILLSWVGMGAFYSLLRQVDVSPWRAALATTALALNPLYFLLQGTFMTDVPSLSMALTALALYGIALRRQNIAALAAACAVAVLAAVTRQNTVVVSLVAAFLVWSNPSLRRQFLWWLGALVPLAAGLVVHFWFQRRSDIRAMPPSLPMPTSVLSLPFVTVHFAGLSALPLLLDRVRRADWKAFGWCFCCLILCAAYWLLYSGNLPYRGVFPYTENMLTPWGPFGASGDYSVGERPLILETPVRLLLSLLGCAAGAALCVRIIPQWRWEALRRPLVLFTVLQVPFLFLVPAIFDRYLLSLIPGAIALAAVKPAGLERRDSKLGWLPGAAILAGVGLFSIGLMHDWLSWNSARWELGRRATLNRNIDPLDIEGGFEWDATYVRPTKLPNTTLKSAWAVLPFTGRWFPGITGRYVLSFTEWRGSRLLDAEPYTLWLAPGKRRFFLLEMPRLSATASK